jgi:methyltransferase (TIGR00027 family)
MEDDLIRHISDTALWIAGFRAEETERPDAVFKDDLAAKLAGERGKRIVAATPHREDMAFAMVVRTTAIDRLILEAIALGVNMVINLGAGLDTRPYRMKLPPDLRWVEVDFPKLIDYKNSLLADQKPVCQLERIPADLSNEKQSKEIFKKLGTESQKALIITEGVVGYLENWQAARLAYDLHAIPSFKYWIMDIARGSLRKTHSKKLSKILKQTPLRFDVEDPLKFFATDGWRVKDVIYILDEADRIGRKLPSRFPWNVLMKIFPKLIRRMANRTYGYVLFERLD